MNDRLTTSPSAASQTRSQQREQEEMLEDESDEAFARRLQEQEEGWAMGTYGEYHSGNIRGQRLLDKYAASSA